MPLLNTADKVYFGSSVVERVYLGSTLVWEPISEIPVEDDPYGNGVYGDPLTFTTAGAPGPYVIGSGERKRVAVHLEQLETNYLNIGEPYRIDFDVTASNNTVFTVDWCDVSPNFSQVVEAGKHYSHESQGRVGGYSSTYRFADFQCDVGGSVTVNNIMIRRIYEFSS